MANVMLKGGPGMAMLCVVRGRLHGWCGRWGVASRQACRVKEEGEWSKGGALDHYHLHRFHHPWLVVMMMLVLDQCLALAAANCSANHTQKGREALSPPPPASIHAPALNDCPCPLQAGNCTLSDRSDPHNEFVGKNVLMTFFQDPAALPAMKEAGLNTQQ